MTYPYHENPGATHFEGCWKTAGHMNCTVAKVYELERELAEVRGENEGLREILSDAEEQLCDVLGIPYPCEHGPEYKIAGAFSLISTLAMKYQQALRDLEAAREELRDAKYELSQCDDIKLNQPLAGAICELQADRERLQRELEAARGERDAFKEYARHKLHCRMLDVLDHVADCTCGLDELFPAKRRKTK